MAHCLTLLASTLAGLHGSVHSKGLTETLTPLECALTKNRGVVQLRRKETTISQRAIRSIETGAPEAPTGIRNFCSSVFLTVSFCAR